SSISSYGYYDLSGGTFQTSGIIAGGNDDGAGIVNQTGGAVTITSAAMTDGGLRIGHSGSGLGVYNLTGGTCTVNRFYVSIGGSSTRGPSGQLNVGGTGQFTIVAQEGDAGYLRVGYNNPSHGNVNLATGGVLTVPWIQSGDGVTSTTASTTSAVNFHGGTLRANMDQADFMRQINAYVYGEGAKIDTDGFNVTINSNLLAPTDYGVGSIALADGGSGYVGPPAVKITGGSGTGATAIANVAGGVVTGITVTNPGSGYESEDVLTVAILGGGAATAGAVDTISLNSGNLSGGLEKSGEGTLTLAGANTYAGVTQVKAGELAVTGSLAGDVVLDAGAALLGTGMIGGSVIAPDDSEVAPGMSVGTISIDGNVMLAGALTIEYEFDDVLEDEVFDSLNVTGDLDITGASLAFTDIQEGGTTLDNGAYVFARYGTLNGTFDMVSGLPTGYVIDYAYEGNAIAITVIPEPSTAVLLTLLLTGLGLRRRERV
ncbi:MAG TPA: hypothetical protein DD670_08460, partial [Planctomycetaceae bacterium]|nr:hypothetical protein [Planctomycetaceae bacterium]